MQSISVAIKGKGFSKFLNRAIDLGKRYGFSSNKMDQNLIQFVNILDQYKCGATFPITGIVLKRNIRTILNYLPSNIEFAVHGFYHIDQTLLTSTELEGDLMRAKDLYQENRIECRGFRSPYLRANEITLEALKQSGYNYDSSQAIFLEVGGEFETESYQKAKDFYRAIPASDFPVLPYWENGMLRIPYCLPDDEALVERFRLDSDELISALWLVILDKTYKSGELFTLGLHPERISHCQKGINEVLKTARSYNPKVWIARLDEIAEWWTALKQTKVSLTAIEKNHLHIRVTGPDELSLMVRNVAVAEPSFEWNKGVQIITGNEVSVRSNQIPFIGVPMEASSRLINFLRQQGFIVEKTADPEKYSFYLGQTEVDRKNERKLLNEISKGDFPLVRIGRWPNGAQSALSVTGDIDAITINDYIMRLIGR